MRSPHAQQSQPRVFQHRPKGCNSEARSRRPESFVRRLAREAKEAKEDPWLQRCETFVQCTVGVSRACCAPTLL